MSEFNLKAEAAVHIDTTLQGLAHSPEEYRTLVAQAQVADDEDQRLTIKQALKKYKKAVFWAMFLSTSLIMEGYDVVVINSYYGQTQFIDRFGEGTPKEITAPWQSGLSNGAVVGEIIGLAINGWAMDKFGCRKTMLVAMSFMFLTIFVPVFAPSLPVLLVGQILMGIPWGIFQTLSTTYAAEITPTVLRPYMTSYVCICWGIGIFLSSIVVRATLGVDGNLAWRLPFALQWVWPIPLLIGIWFCPESPWYHVRQGQFQEAKESLGRLRQPVKDDAELNASVALLAHTTAVERAQTMGATYLACFRGVNLRRTEINCVVWAAQILCGNALLGFDVLFFQRAGLSEVWSFNLNIITNAQYITGGILCWFLMAKLGRATLYMGGLAGMFVCLIVMGALGCVENTKTSWAIGSLLVFMTLINMTTIGPVCYPLVAETCSGPLRAKSIVIGRIVYNLTGIFQNIVTPRMLSPAAWGWGAKAAFFYAGTNFLCLVWCWFRLPETKDRSFGALEILFDKRVPARKFKYTNVDQFAETMEKGVQSRDKPSSIGDDKVNPSEHVEGARY